MRIPCSTEQGIILVEQELMRENREFYWPELKSTPDEILATKDLRVIVRSYPESRH